MPYKSGLGLYVPKRASDFLIQRMGLDEKLGLLTPYRDMIRISKDDAKERIWRTILQALQRKPILVRASDRPKDILRDQGGLRRTHWYVGVDLTYEGAVELTLMSPVKYGGFVGEHANCVTLRLTDDNEKFWNGLQRIIHEL